MVGGGVPSFPAPRDGGTSPNTKQQRQQQVCDLPSSHMRGMPGFAGRYHPFWQILFMRGKQC